MKKGFAELANVGYPGMEGVRLIYPNGAGQWFDAKKLKESPDDVVKYLNDWMRECTDHFDNRKCES